MKNSKPDTNYISNLELREEIKLNFLGGHDFKGSLEIEKSFEEEDQVQKSKLFELLDDIMFPKVRQINDTCFPSSNHSLILNFVN